MKYQTVGRPHSIDFVHQVPGLLLAASLMAGCGGTTSDFGPVVPAPSVSALTLMASPGSPSAPQTITVAVHNDDALTAKLTVGTQFSLVAPASCAQGLTTCHISVAYSPRMGGIQHDTLVLTDTSTGLSASVALTGMPPNAAPVLSSQQISFPTVPVGQSASITLTARAQYSDATTATITPSDTPFQITQGATCSQGTAACTIQISFAPPQPGAYSAALTVTDTTTGLTSTAALSGTGMIPNRPPVVSATAVNFGNEAVGQTAAAQTVSITAQYQDAVTASITTQTGAAGTFRLLPATGCTQGAAACTLSVAFSPAQAGPASGTLTVTDAVNGLSNAVALSGNGIVPPTVSPTTLSFGNEEIGLASATQIVTVQPQVQSQSQDAVTAVVQPSTSYRLTQGTSCAKGASTCSFTVAFSPMQTGANPGTLVVTDTTNGLSTTVNLSGTGYGIVGAMSGLDYYLPFTDNAGTTITDASGNGRNGTISGSGRQSVWEGNVGLALYDQMLTIPNASGRPVRGICAYFPAVQTDNTDYNYLYSLAVGSASGQSFGSFSGSGDQGHGPDADFPGIGFSNGATRTASVEGFSGIHCEEEIIGTSASDLDHIIVDGQEVPYAMQSFSVAQVNAAGLTAPMMMQSATSGFTQPPPVFYSVWGAGVTDTMQQAEARTVSELSRLTSLGVSVTPPASSATDSTCSITGNSIDQGYRASQPPSNLLNLNFPCTIHNFAVSGQGTKEMAAGVQDREATVYHHLAARNIAYMGGPINSVVKYLELSQNAYQDIVDWNNKVHALGYKTIVSTMLSQCGVGSHGYTGDQLKQQVNALILANADQFDWVSNQAAAPQLGADGACANTTYFADGTHITDTGQGYYIAAERAAFEGVYTTPMTSISAAYTQIPSDTNIQASGNTPYTISLMDANTANFNSKGTLCISNTGTATLTVAAITGQTVLGAPSIPLAAGATQCIRANVPDATVAGAVWIAAP